MTQICDGRATERQRILDEASDDSKVVAARRRAKEEISNLVREATKEVAHNDLETETTRAQGAEAGRLVGSRWKTSVTPQRWAARHKAARGDEGRVGLCSVARGVLQGHEASSEL